MSPVETIALIIALATIVKLVFFLTKPQAWFNGVGKFWNMRGVATTISIVLGVLVLYYLLAELTIVQIYATSAFMAMFVWLALAPYRQDIYNSVVNVLTVGSVWKKNWLAIVIWLLLTLWVLKDLFA